MALKRQENLRLRRPRATHHAADTVRPPVAQSIAMPPLTCSVTPVT